MKFIKDMPRMPKKRRYGKSAIVGRDISNGMKPVALIVLEDEIENELRVYDIQHAQLQELSNHSSDDENYVNNIFYNLDLLLDIAFDLLVLS